MEIFKKISDLLTPPPVPKAPKAPLIPPTDPGQDLAASIRPHLRSLCSADSLNDPVVKECLAELKQVAMRRGLYLTAFEVKNQLDMLTRTNEEKQVYQKSRGYVLAADFFLGHVRQEIEGVKTRSRNVGPNVFRGYCDEMVGCLLQGENARRAVEIPVLVIEELLATAVDASDRGELFLELAGRAVASAAELIKDSLAQQLGRSTSKFSSDSGITDTSQRRQRGGAGLDESAARYLTDLQAKTTAIHAAFRQCQAQNPDATGPAFLLNLQRATESLGCAPFSAILQERLGAQLEQTRADDAMKYLEQAGERYESQGDRERGLSLVKLAGLRYRKAHELYQRANAQQHAASAQAKLSELTAPKLP